MDLTSSEEPAATPVTILHERVGGERAEKKDTSDVCLTAVFDKYTKLQDTTFALFKQDRNNYLLHFHLESHDRCDVKIKPLLWDQGAYFKPALLTDGALRLVPHFLPIAFREGAALKRSLSPAAPANAVVSSPIPQRKRIERVESPTPASILSLIEEVRTVHDQRLAAVEQRAEEEELAEEEASKLPQAKPHTVRKNNATAIERSTYSLPKTIQRRGVRVRYDHGIFVPRALEPLPKDVTQASWNIDFAAAKQRYADKRFGGVVPTVHGTMLNGMHHVAHEEMIEGKYGMVALKPCSRCVDAGETCRVYHSECYEWTVEGCNMKNQLGWRCYRCRSVDGRILGPGGCNAQFQA